MAARANIRERRSRGRAVRVSGHMAGHASAGAREIDPAAVGGSFEIPDAAPSKGQWRWMFCSIMWAIDPGFSPICSWTPTNRRFGLLFQKFRGQSERGISVLTDEIAKRAAVDEGKVIFEIKGTIDAAGRQGAHANRPACRQAI